MAGLRGRSPAWDRFGHWAPLAAMLVLALTALLLAAAEEIAERLDELKAVEAALITGVDREFRFHSGVPAAA